MCDMNPRILATPGPLKGSVSAVTPESVTLCRDPRIIVLTGALGRKSFQITESALTIGRDPSNDICVDDDTASRRHCVIRLENGCPVLVDQYSRNGTYVNGFFFPTKVA